MELCRAMRERSAVGIIVISARRGERDKVGALNMGADDYMTKPFSIEELLARITATLRRSRPAMSPEPPLTRVVVGDIEIDLAGQRVTRGGSDIHLTTTEFALLRELAVDRGKLLSHVRRLRAKLEVDGAPRLIITQPRAGYRLAAE
jgi:two-component system, OmpR family, KDP operon response regulator KdpE